MEAKLLARLRPADDTEQALSDALARISNERLAADARLIELRQSRAAMLLSGTPKQVAEAEATAHETSILMEQLEVMAAEIGPKMDASHSRNVVARLEEKAAEVRATLARANAWLKGDYPALARQIVEGIHLCRAAENDASALRHEIGGASRNDAVAKLIGASSDLHLPEPPRVPVAGVGNVPPSQAIQLPAGPEGLPAFWWPPTLYGRARSPGF